MLDRFTGLQKLATQRGVDIYFKETNALAGGANWSLLCTLVLGQNFALRMDVLPDLRTSLSERRNLSSNILPSENHLVNMTRPKLAAPLLLVLPSLGVAAS